MLTIEQITKGIQTEMRKVSQYVDDLATAGDNAAVTDVEYEVAKAKASLRISDESIEKLTVSELAHRTLLETRDEYQAYLIAKYRHDNMKSALRAAQSRLDALRTLMTSLRVAGG
jgi:hypothetical protein